jgi:hypothetical protein
LDKDKDPFGDSDFMDQRHQLVKTETLSMRHAETEVNSQLRKLETKKRKCDSGLKETKEQENKNQPMRERELKKDPQRRTKPEQVPTQKIDQKPPMNVKEKA